MTYLAVILGQVVFVRGLQEARELNVKGSIVDSRYKSTTPLPWNIAIWKVKPRFAAPHEFTALSNLPPGFGKFSFAHPWDKPSFADQTS